MKNYYAETQLFNPNLNFKKADLKQMSQNEILKKLAISESMPNVVEVT